MNRPHSATPQIRTRAGRGSGVVELRVVREPHHWAYRTRPQDRLVDLPATVGARHPSRVVPPTALLRRCDHPASEVQMQTLSAPPAPGVDVPDEAPARWRCVLGFPLPQGALAARPARAADHRGLRDRASDRRAGALAQPAPAHGLLLRDRARRDHRLPPAVHPPQLRGAPAAQGDPGGARIDVVPGFDHRLGRRPPPPPPLLRPARRPPLPGATCRRAVAGLAAASCTRTPAGCSATRRHAACDEFFAPTARRPRPRAHRPAVRAVLHRDALASAVRARVRAHRHPRRRARRARVRRGPPGRHRSQPHVGDQLRVPPFGKRPFRTRDRSTNFAPLAMLTGRRVVAQRAPRVPTLAPPPASTADSSTRRRG